VFAGVLVLAALTMTAAAVAAMRVASTSEGLLPGLALAERGMAVTVTGTVAEEPRAVRYGGQLVVLSVDQVATGSQAWRTRERAAVVLSRDAGPLGTGGAVAVGDQLRLHAAVEPAPHADPLGLGSPPSVSLARPHLEAWAPAGSRLLQASETVRAAARSRALASLPSEHAGLLVGMALGDTSLLGGDLDHAFKAAGLSHLLAASGENLAVLLAAGLGLMVALGAGRPLLATAGILLTAAFALLTRWEPSVLRASVMAVLMLAGVATGRGPGGRRALCLAVVFLLLANPALAVMLGFQLSVAATAGVLWLGPPIARALPRWLPRPVRTATGFSLGAQAAALPAVALTLGQLSLAGLPANLLALPLATPPMLLGVVAALTAPFAPPLATVACRLAAPFLAALLAVAQAAAHLPPGTMVLPGPTRLIPALAVLVLACGCLVRQRITAARRRAANPRRRHQPGWSGDPGVL